MPREVVTASLDVKGTEKQIARMRNARQEREVTKLIREKGLTMSQRTMSQRSSQLKSRTRSMIEMELSNDDECSVERVGEPIMYIDVNISPGWKERIDVYQGNQAQELARSFIKKHALDRDLTPKLMTLIEEQLAKL